ncbi:hypothetical protein ACFPM0_24540 [Pseudonocardia sulfidoxydans]|uniref:hypothetical protein n=1 Tax=Pseudonocardia sulfidoxydans TaxID=54011 RepID=UPI003622F23B
MNYIRTSAITLASSPSVTGWATWLRPIGVVAAECVTDCSDPLDVAPRGDHTPVYPRTPARVVGRSSPAAKDRA